MPKTLPQGRDDSLQGLVTRLRAARTIVDKAVICNNSTAVRQFRDSPWHELKAVGLTEAMLDIVTSEDFVAMTSTLEKVWRHLALLDPAYSFALSYLGGRQTSHNGRGHISPRGSSQ